MKQVILVMAMALMSAMQANAQNVKIDDKEIVGAWLMESMQWEGENKIVCGKETGYVQFKYYGADGEYACALLVLSDGKCAVVPHEHGTYTFKMDGIQKWDVKDSKMPLSGLTRLQQNAHGTLVMTFGKSRPTCPKNSSNLSLTAARQKKHLRTCCS